MGRVANAVAKFLIKHYFDEYTGEQKDVICSAIDKHGTGAYRHFISSNNDYKLSANEMREVLKHIDVVTANSSNLLHLSSLPKTSLLYFARVHNEITETKTGPVPLSAALKNNAKFSYTSYEECLLKTYYEVACHIQDRLSFLGRTNEDVLASLEFAKEKLINPYLKDGYEGDIFQRTALTQIRYACREKVDVLRLLNCKYTPEKIIFLTNAMLNGVDNETLDSMCNPDLTTQKMFEIEYGENPFETKQEQVSIPKKEGPDFKLNDLVIDNEGRRGRCMGYDPNTSKYQVLFIDAENISADGWYSAEQLSPYTLENKKKPEKVSNIDDLISQATAISEQSKGLADNLGKFRDGFEMTD